MASANSGVLRRMLVPPGFLVSDEKDSTYLFHHIPSKAQGRGQCGRLGSDS